MRIKDINGRWLERCPHCGRWFRTLNYKRHLKNCEAPTEKEMFS